MLSRVNGNEVGEGFFVVVEFAEKHVTIIRDDRAGGVAVVFLVGSLPSMV